MKLLLKWGIWCEEANNASFYAKLVEVMKVEEAATPFFLGDPELCSSMHQEYILWLDKELSSTVNVAVNFICG